MPFVKRRIFHRWTLSGLLGGVLAGCGRPPAHTRIACEGDSITFGHKVDDRENRSYPAQLQALLGVGYEVRNFGFNGATLLAEGDYPFIATQAAADAVAYDPHVVVFMLGTNDAKRWNWKKRENFVANGVDLLGRHRPSARRILCLPPPDFPDQIGIQEEILIEEVIPELREVALSSGAEVIDLHTPFLDKPEWFPDQVHPSVEAHTEMALIVSKAILAAG